MNNMNLRMNAHTNQELMNAAVQLDKIIPCLYSINLFEFSYLEMRIMERHLKRELAACQRAMDILGFYKDEIAATRHKAPIIAKMDDIQEALDTLTQQMMAI